MMPPSQEYLKIRCKAMRHLQQKPAGVPGPYRPSATGFEPHGRTDTVIFRIFYGTASNPRVERGVGHDSETTLGFDLGVCKRSHVKHYFRWQGFVEVIGGNIRDFRGYISIPHHRCQYA